MNKLLWFLALLSVSCANSVSSLVEKETSSSMPQCNPTTVEWFPHPYSCEMYVLCFNGNPIARYCAPNLHFSPEQRDCMLPRLANCKISAFCPEVDDVMNPVFFADINDCTKFFFCSSGKAIERSCSHGLFFDVKSQWCTTPENVTCDPRTPNAPIIRPPVPIDTSICTWHENVNDSNRRYLKTVCRYSIGRTHEDASIVCRTHGMRLLRIEDSSVQKAIFDLIAVKVGRGTRGIFHVSGRNRNGFWYNDDNTRINENLRWSGGQISVSGCLGLVNDNIMVFHGLPCGNIYQSLCEFIQ